MPTIFKWTKLHQDSKYIHIGYVFSYKGQAKPIKHQIFDSYLAMLISYLIGFLKSSGQTAL